MVISLLLTISSFINFSPKEIHLFYLPGGVVQQEGGDASSAFYGRYEYRMILRAFERSGYQVSGVLRDASGEEGLVEGMHRRIDSLINAGVDPSNIVVVGASQGGYYATEIADRVSHQQVKYAVLGLCSEYAVDYFSSKALCGDFFSIYEQSDRKQSCDGIFSTQKCISSYRELAIDMGISHAFLYKPYSAWLEPLKDWIEN